MAGLDQQTQPAIGARVKAESFRVGADQTRDPERIVLVTIHGRGNSENDRMHGTVASSIKDELARRNGSYSVTHLRVGYDDRAPIPELAKSIHETLSKSGLPEDARVIMVGHSQGSYLGYRLAALGPLTKGRQALIAVDPPSIPANKLLGPLLAVQDALTPDRSMLGRLTFPHIGHEISRQQNKVTKGTAPAGFAYEVVPTVVHDPFHGVDAVSGDERTKSNKDLSSVRQALSNALGNSF